MAREENLLFKDLCSRLPYGVKVKFYYYLIDEYEIIPLTAKLLSDTVYIGDIKPYLFPLSSMTEEMIEELNANGFFKYRDTFANVSHLISNGKIAEEIYTYIDIEGISYLIEFFHKYHIDYKGLIESGLALDATGLNIY